MGQDATRGLTDLRQSLIAHTRNLSLNTAAPAAASDQTSREAGDTTETTPTESKDRSAEDAMKESETVLSRLRGEAAKRLKDLQKAEDAADEALLTFGSNLRDFFRDAISIAPPTGDQADNQGGTVLFESKDAQGKRVIHTSRFDAQLHVIHTSPDSFTKDGNGAEFEGWVKEFDVDKKTEDISGDLAKYPELRATMEQLVPDQVPYADFWQRYYFLRHGIETAEARRRDLLKGGKSTFWFHLVYANSSQQPLQLKRKSPGTRTRMTRLRPSRSPTKRQQPSGPPRPSLRPPSSHLLPALASLSRPSPASPTMRSPRQAATRATMSSAPRRACPAKPPAARRSRGSPTRIATRKTGSDVAVPVHFKSEGSNVVEAGVWVGWVGLDRRSYVYAGRIKRSRGFAIPRLVISRDVNLRQVQRLSSPAPDLPLDHSFPLPRHLGKPIVIHLRLLLLFPHQRGRLPHLHILLLVILIVIRIGLLLLLILRLLENNRIPLLALPPPPQPLHLVKLAPQTLAPHPHHLLGHLERRVVIHIHLELVQHHLQQHTFNIFLVRLLELVWYGRGLGLGLCCGLLLLLELGGRERGDVGKELDDGAGEPVALVRRVGASPVVLDCEAQGRPEVEGEGDALFEG